MKITQYHTPHELLLANSCLRQRWGKPPANAVGCPQHNVDILRECPTMQSLPFCRVLVRTETRNEFRMRCFIPLPASDNAGHAPSMLLICYHFCPRLQTQSICRVMIRIDTRNEFRMYCCTPLPASANAGGSPQPLLGDAPSM